MTNDAGSEPTARLYDQLQDRLRARDKEGAIEAYYQLFLAGRPLGEVISKGAPDRGGRGDAELPNPIKSAPDEQAASALGGLVSDDPPAANPDPFKRSAEITSEARSDDAAGGSNFSAHSWFAWRRLWVAGGLLGIGALVAPIALVYGTGLENVAATIKRTAHPAALAITSTSTAPEKPGSALTGLNAELVMSPLSNSADVPGTATGAVAEAVPHPPVATVAATQVVASATPTRDEGADQPGSTPPSKSADAPHPTADAAVEAVPNRSVAADAAPKVAVAEKTEHASPRPSGIETKALVSRADALFGIGDLTAARLFYRRGADLGDGAAAMRLGETFDPTFLQQAGLGHVAGDAEQALYWYRRAEDLGNRDASLLVEGLRPPGSKRQ